MTLKQNLTFVLVYNSEDKNKTDRKYLFDIYEKSKTEPTPVEITKEEYITLAKKYFRKRRKVLQVFLDMGGGGLFPTFIKEREREIAFYTKALEDDKMILASWARPHYKEKGISSGVLIQSDLANALLEIGNDMPSSREELEKKVIPVVPSENNPQGLFLSKAYKGKKTAVYINPINDTAITMTEAVDLISIIPSLRVKQVIGALSDFANKYEVWEFKDIKLTDIMRLMSADKKKKFKQEEKKEIGDIIIGLYHCSWSMLRPNGEGRRFYRFLDGLDITKYAKRLKRGVEKKLVKGVLTDVEYKKGDINQNIISRFSVELFPRLKKDAYGVVFPRSFIEAPKHKKSYSGLEYLIYHRYSRNPDKEYLSKNREELMRGADYTKTNETNRSMATQLLEKLLCELIENKVLSKYEPKELPLDDKAMIKMYIHPEWKAEAKRVKSSVFTSGQTK